MALASYSRCARVNRLPAAYIAGTLERDFERYDSAPPGDWEIVLSNRKQGPEAAMELVEARAPDRVCPTRRCSGRGGTCNPLPQV